MHLDLIKIKLRTANVPAYRQNQRKKYSYTGDVHKGYEG